MPWPTDPAEQYFGRGLWGHDGADWQKLALLWGYSDRLAELTLYTQTTAATALQTLFTVPAGYVYVVKSTMSLNRNTIQVHNHLLHNAVTYFPIAGFAAQPIGVWAVNDNVDYPLKAGDSLRFQFLGCGAGDLLEFAAWGYKMKVT